MKELILDLLAPKPTKASGVNFQWGVTLYGDSIMHGGIAEALKRSGYNGLIQDRSIPGDTAANAWRRIPYEQRSTTHVVVQYGTNDLTQGNNPSKHLKKILKYLNKEGRFVILTGLSKRESMNVLKQNYELQLLAAEVGVTYAHWGTVPLVSLDGLHPVQPMINDLANKIITSL